MATNIIETLLDKLKSEMSICHLRPSAPAEDAPEPSHDIPVNEGDDDASSFTEEIPAAEPGRSDPVAA